MLSNWTVHNFQNEILNNFKCKKEFPAVTICNQNQMKRSSVFGTRFEPLLNIDDQIQADQAQFQALNVRKRRQISGEFFSTAQSQSITIFSGHTDIQAANFSSFVNGNGSIEWDRILVEVDASQMVHLGDHLTFTPDEISSYGHPIDELLVDVRI